VAVHEDVSDVEVAVVAAGVAVVGKDDVELVVA
jgi:hypothetical protein